MVFQFEEWTTDEVIEWLENTNPVLRKKYETNFREEGVDGKMLAFLDNDALENDLGVESKLHRSLLLETFQGLKRSSTADYQATTSADELQSGDEFHDEFRAPATARTQNTKSLPVVIRDDDHNSNSKNGVEVDLASIGIQVSLPPTVVPSVNQEAEDQERPSDDNALSPPSDIEKEDAVGAGQAAAATASLDEMPYHTSRGVVGQAGFSGHSGMESSVLRFRNVNFLVETDSGPRNVLTDISGSVRWGRVLAILGPSGAGKTTFLNVLTLDAHYGAPLGDVTLNGVPMMDDVFKAHCYSVVQEDNHWPFLTCRETLRYVAELYDLDDDDHIDGIVDEMIDKMGLRVCENTRNSRLSGGQRRRLSLGVALLKQPTVLFLDEPTTGLDASASENIMNEIVRIAKEERLIVICTIHQPSTKVYNGFDQVMILSKGRVAYNGDVSEANKYFAAIGFPLPPKTNPAEHFMDLVNSDFSDDAKVDRILDIWEENGARSSHHNYLKDGEGQDGVTNMKRSSFSREFVILLRRHALLIARDPLLYSGRCVATLLVNIVFSLVYIKSRDYDQDQAQNKFWMIVWHYSAAAQMGAVAVYALNEEFKTVVRETKNGMIDPGTYVLAKSILVLPIIFLLALFALLIPSVVMADFPIESFGTSLFLWAIHMYGYENLAECLSVWFDDPILGMLQYMNWWFAGFLFGGFLIPKSDLFYPFKIFYFITPGSYYIRTMARENLIDSMWESCDLPSNTTQPVCVDDPATGEKVLTALSKVFSVISTDDHLVEDIGVLLAIAAFFKLMYFVGAVANANRVADIYSFDPLM